MSVVILSYFCVCANIQLFNIWFPKQTWLFIKIVVLLITQLCLTLCDPMDWSPAASSVHGVQARILEWVATPFLRGSS